MLTCLTRAEPGSHLTGALCSRIAPSPMMTRYAVANFGNGFDEPLHTLLLQHRPCHLCYDEHAHEHGGQASDREETGWTLSQ